MQRLHFLLSASVAMGLVACSESNDGASAAPTNQDDDPVTTPVDESMGDGDGDSDDEEEEEDTGDGDGDTPANCNASGPTVDADMDGFTPEQGDCNDCSAEINPGAYDFPGDKWDEDCSGAPAETAEDNCDMGLNIASTAAEDAARAIGLCKFTTESEKGWGVISARFTQPNGSGALPDAAAVGLLPDFGAAKPRAGAAMLALSSGVARSPSQQGYTEACDTFDGPPDPLTTELCLLLNNCSGKHTPPSGYPKPSSACPSAGGTNTPIFNGAALEVKVRVPTNANSFAFESIFYSSEYPQFICNKYNDFFAVMMEPAPAGLSDGNIIFDSNKDPIGVNTGLLAVCDPSTQWASAAKKFECSQGIDLLVGTGYGSGESSCASVDQNGNGYVGGASTGWLQTTVPVDGGIITLRFTIWDTGDAILDSTALVDKFQWSVDEPQVETTPVVL